LVRSGDIPVKRERVLKSISEPTYWEKYRGKDATGICEATWSEKGAGGAEHSTRAGFNKTGGGEIYWGNDLDLKNQTGRRDGYRTQGAASSGGNG